MPQPHGGERRFNRIGRADVLCTQQRCSRVVGYTCGKAFQNPKAPSAVASFGSTVKAVGIECFDDGADVVLGKVKTSRNIRGLRTLR
jgi:hypothetical protein